MFYFVFFSIHFFLRFTHSVCIFLYVETQTNVIQLIFQWVLLLNPPFYPSVYILLFELPEFVATNFNYHLIAVGRDKIKGNISKDTYIQYYLFFLILYV